MSRYLLDTNILLGFVRSAPWATKIREEHDLADPERMVYTSVVCKGEIFALAEKFGWGRNKRTQLQRVLSRVPTPYLDEAVVSVNRRLDARNIGGLSQQRSSTTSGCRNVPKRPLDCCYRLCEGGCAHFDGRRFRSPERRLAATHLR